MEQAVIRALVRVLLRDLGHLRAQYRLVDRPGLERCGPGHVVEVCPQPPLPWPRDVLEHVHVTAGEISLLQLTRSGRRKRNGYRTYCTSDPNCLNALVQQIHKSLKEPLPNRCRAENDVDRSGSADRIDKRRTA